MSTRSASPSAALETRTGEPMSSPRVIENVAAATQVRDPERYQIINEHGRGGLGRVLRAHDRELGRDVAIKELITRGDIGEVRFLREALITARLEHPGIVPVHEAGRWPDGTPFYAMKLVAGRSLRALIAERPSLEQRLALLPHVIAVADAIAYAHGRDIIHRDLKPANVIVGEFGETVVIDWGLAKDLSAFDAGSLGGGPYRSPADSELTSTGSVLGTPAYMAPEQERGEHVDQRADVYAIGAMLWELCGPRKTPPSEARTHHRQLRRAGLDRDLITIVYKALEPDPARRYPDAGALAADLKAFTAGARIGARRYSLFAVLAHWTRQHRAIAISALAAVAIAVAAGTLFVRGIARERDRADREAAEATAHQRAAERAKDDLMLQHAELLLVTDPTAAHELLAGYRGEAAGRADQLRARAVALGVARFRASPHDAAIAFARALGDGALLTIGGGTVARTTPAGASRVVARGAARQGIASFAAARQLLAYACEPAGVCLLDAARERPRPGPAGATPPSALAFSPSGRQLAALSAGGAITVWTIPDDGAPVVRARHLLTSGVLVEFDGEDRVVAAARDHVEVLRLGATVERVQHIALRDPVALEVSGDGDLAIASSHGELVLGHAGAARAPIQVCKTGLNSLAFVPHRDALAFACQDGVAGALDVRTGARALATQIDGGGVLVVASPDGNSLAFGENGGAVQVYDYRSARFHRLLGHRRQITALAFAGDAILSGDTGGRLAAWPMPSTAIRMVLEPGQRPVAAVALPANGALVVTGTLSVSWSARGEHGQLPGHDPLRYFLAYSKVRPEVILYGGDDALERWSLAATPTSRVLHTGQGSVTAVRYLADGERFVTGGVDGRVLVWRGEVARELAALDEPVAMLTVVPGSEAVAALGASGRLWRIADGQAVALGAVPGVSTLIASPGGRWLGLWGPRGTVVVYDTATWQAVREVFPAGLRGFAFAADDRELAVITGEAIERVPLSSAGLGAPRVRVALPARALAYSPDGAWLAVPCTDGTLWLWSRATGAWTAHVVSATEVMTGVFALDGKSYLVSDGSHVFRVDMSALALERSPSTGTTP